MRGESGLSALFVWSLKAGSRVLGLTEPNPISHCQFESQPAPRFSPLSVPLLLPSPHPSSPCRQIGIPAADVAVVVRSNLPCGVYLVGAGPLSGWLSLLLTKAVNL